MKNAENRSAFSKIKAVVWYRPVLNDSQSRLCVGLLVCRFLLCHRYKKRLKKLLIVHPTFFLRTVVVMTRPFIRFVSCLFYCFFIVELSYS